MAPSQTFRAQLAKAKRGDRAAQGFVFSCHSFGQEGVAIDFKLAFKFCRMAAEGGHTTCQVSLGGLYCKGKGVEPDQRKAAAWYLRAAKEGGDANAQYFSAQRYRTGNGHDAPKVEEASKWYQAAVAQGHAATEYALGYYYDEGDGVPKIPGLELKLWRRCAQHIHETGNNAKYIDPVAAAHHAIGNCYCHGSYGIEVDLSMAMQWWTKAVELGNIHVQCYIGEIYLTGFLGELVPVGTFDRDVPLGMKQLKAVTVAGRKCDGDEEIIWMPRS